MMKWKASFSPPGKFFFFSSCIFLVILYIVLAERCNDKSTSSGKRSRYIKIPTDFCA